MIITESMSIGTLVNNLLAPEILTNMAFAILIYSMFCLEKAPLMNVIRSSNPHTVSRSIPVQMSVHFVVIATDMLRIPPIASWEPFRKRSLRAFERNITAAHDAKTKIFETMSQVEGHLSGYIMWVLRCHGRVHLENVVQTV